MNNYHTLGIPVVPSPTSSNGPSSLPAPPYTSLSSTGSANYAAVTSTNNPTQTGLNGAIFNGNTMRAGSNGSHPRSSDGESDHEYYNDVDRLQREMQPLQQQPQGSWRGQQHRWGRWQGWQQRQQPRKQREPKNRIVSVVIPCDLTWNCCFISVCNAWPPLFLTISVFRLHSISTISCAR